MIPEGYERHLVRQELNKNPIDSDPFKILGVSNEDKMTFFLLKWVFNAIKIMPNLDEKNSQPYVMKEELCQQLFKNEEIMKALGYKNMHEMQK